MIYLQFICKIYTEIINLAHFLYGRMYRIYTEYFKYTHFPYDRMYRIYTEFIQNLIGHFLDKKYTKSVQILYISHCSF